MRCPEHGKLHHIRFSRLQDGRFLALMVAEIEDLPFLHRPLQHACHAHGQRRVHCSRLERRGFHDSHVRAPDPMIQVFDICSEIRALPGLQNIVRPFKIQDIFRDPFSVISPAVILVCLCFRIPARAHLCAFIFLLNCPDGGIQPVEILKAAAPHVPQSSSQRKAEGAHGDEDSEQQAFQRAPAHLFYTVIECHPQHLTVPLSSFRPS